MIKYGEVSWKLPGWHQLDRHAEIGRARVGALLSFPDGMFNARRRDIIGFATANRLPTI